ncbi:IS3 family transposase [Nonomuraea terrae]|uniref:IS3 family transposase n=1 Tax=Nonomuraea terrae TaxID=2530383 RepID=UPI0037A1718B
MDGLHRRALPAVLVAEVFASSHGTYGYRRVHAALARRGEHCSAELVRALMRDQDLAPGAGTGVPAGHHRRRRLPWHP